MTPPDLQAVADGLSEAMQRCLLKADANHTSAFSLRAIVPTCDALAKRGLLTRKLGVGAFWSPQTAIEYRLTPLGQQVRQLLIDREGEGK